MARCTSSGRTLELKPLYLRLWELILGSVKIAVDETMAPVFDPGRGRTKKGYFWAITRDDRSWGGTDPPAVAYTYAPGCGAVHALKLLETYRGIVQRTGLALLRSSRPANCMASIRKPTSPTCSSSSSISGPNRASTNSCPGPGRKVAQPIGSRRDLHRLRKSRRSRRTKQSSSQSREIREPLTFSR
jgi:hypothetical protein